jgi:hypothetical protein
LGEISATSNAKTLEQLFPTVSQIIFRRVEGLENIVLSSDQMTTHGHGSQKDFLQRLEHVEVKECGQLPSLQELTIDGHEEWGNLLTQLRVRPLYFSPDFLFLNLNCQIHTL